MNNLQPAHSFHSYTSTEMEGPADAGNVVTPDQKPSGTTPTSQFPYLQVLTETGFTLPPALFTKEVINGIF